MWHLHGGCGEFPNEPVRSLMSRPSGSVAGPTRPSTGGGEDRCPAGINVIIGMHVRAHGLPIAPALRWISDDGERGVGLGGGLGRWSLLPTYPIS